MQLTSSETLQSQRCSIPSSHSQRPPANVQSDVHSSFLLVLPVLSAASCPWNASYYFLWCVVHTATPLAIMVITQQACYLRITLSLTCVTTALLVIIIAAKKKSLMEVNIFSSGVQKSLQQLHCLKIKFVCTPPCKNMISSAQSPLRLPVCPLTGHVDYLLWGEERKQTHDNSQSDTYSSSRKGKFLNASSGNWVMLFILISLENKVSKIVN